MPPVQRTFTIIPQGRSLVNNGAADSGPVRPMTSKQVRKAYKAANKAPSMSKAERIKQERAEQERIRKEFEKEKAAARAKAARERKREKELAEKAEKKKNRQPLVTVRPSQDTISWFVRGNGSGKKRDCAGQGVEKEKTPEPARLPSPIAEESEEEEVLEASLAKSPTQEELQESKKALDADENPDAPVERHLTTQLDVVDFQMMDDLDVSFGGPDDNPFSGDAIAKATVTKNLEPKPQDSSLGMRDVLDVGTGGNPTQPSSDCRPVTAAAETFLQPKPKSPRLEQKSLPEIDLISEEDDFELEMLALEAMTQQKQLSQKPSQKFSQRSNQRSSQNLKTYNSTPNTLQNPVRKSTSFERDLGLDVKSLLDTPIAKPPANKPPDRKLPAPLPPPPPPPPPPRRRSPSPTSPIARRPQSPPLSTQAIFSNLDDFFPTSSQLALELEEDIEFSTPKPKTPASKHTSLYRPPEILSPEMASESPTPKKHFFTSSSNEMLALAIQRSRQEADLEELRRRDERCLEAGMIAQMEKRAERKKPPVVKVERPKPKIMNTMNQPQPLLYLAEQRLAAIREVDKKATPKDTKRITQWNPNTIRPMQAPRNDAAPKELKKTIPIEPKKPPLIEPKKPTPMQAKVPPMQAPKYVPPQALKNTPIQKAMTIPPPDKKPAPPPKPPSKPGHGNANKENIATPPADMITGSDYLSASQETEYGGDWIDEAALELMI